MAVLHMCVFAAIAVCVPALTHTPSSVVHVHARGAQAGGGCTAQPPDLRQGPRALARTITPLRYLLRSQRASDAVLPVRCMQ